MYQAKRIDVAALEAAMKKSIIEYREKAAITAAVEGFVEKSWPKRPDKRAGDALLAALRNVRTSNPVKYVSYNKVPYSGGIDYEFKLTLSGGYNDTIRYTVRVKEEGGAPDMAYLRMGHAFWGSHADLLEAKLPLLAEKAAQFNAHLEALRELSNFAGDGTTPCEYSLPHLSDAFGWYEFKHI